MSDSSPAGPVFPPFGPAFSRPAAASRPAAPAPQPEAAPDVPQAAAFGGGETRDAEPASAAAPQGLPWELPSASDAADAADAAAPAGGADASADDVDVDVDAEGDEGSEDLPWLEMPAGAPQNHAEPAADPWALPSADAADPAPWEPPAPEALTAAAWEQDEADVPAAAPWEPEADQPAAAAWETPAAADQPSAPDTSWMDWKDPEPAGSADAGTPAPDEPQPTAATQADDIYFGSVHVEPAPGLVPVGDISGSEPEGTAPVFVAPAAPAEAVFVDGQPSAAPDDTNVAPQAVTASADAPAAPSASVAGHFGEVAARLERIARELRSDPQAFLASGTGDPLDLLVTGFVLGASQRR